MVNEKTTMTNEQKIIVCSYATPDMTTSQKKLHESFEFANKKDISDWNISHRFEYHSDYFCQFNKSILNQKRGSGYWLWKPFIIYQSLLESAYNDYVFYSDAGIEVISSIKPLIDLSEDIVLFENVWSHQDWCKAEVLYAMLPGGFSPTRRQLQASVILIKKTERTLEFVRDWLAWCQVPGFIDDSPGKVSNFSGFREHRHDQAILTNMAILHGIKGHWWPADYNAADKVNYPSDTYDITFFHHRRRNAGTVGVCGNNKPLPTW